MSENQRQSDRREYSQRELEHFFTEIQEKLEQIHDQTKLTNGRVSTLENWKSYITGGLAVIVIVLVPIILKLFSP